MSGKTVSQQSALGIRNGEHVLLGNDAFPECGQVAQLLLGGEFVESGWGERQRLRHVGMIARWGRAKQRADASA